MTMSREEKVNVGGVHSWRQATVDLRICGFWKLRLKSGDQNTQFVAGLTTGMEPEDAE